jgi:hypothetical protein
MELIPDGRRQFGIGGREPGRKEPRIRESQLGGRARLGQETPLRLDGTTASANRVMRQPLLPYFDCRCQLRTKSRVMRRPRIAPRIDSLLIALFRSDQAQRPTNQSLTPMLRGRNAVLNAKAKSPLETYHSLLLLLGCVIVDTKKSRCNYDIGINLSTRRGRHG